MRSRREFTDHAFGIAIQRRGIDQLPSVFDKTRGETSLTVYNDDFAIIRDSLKLDLSAGVNDVRYSDVALFVEPSSVILRDPGGK